MRPWSVLAFAELERRAVLWSIALTVLWLAVVHLLGAALVAGQEGPGADLRVGAVTAGALAVVGLTGWSSRAGLCGPVLARRRLVLAPLALSPSPGLPSA